MANAVSVAPSANPVVAYVRSAISSVQEYLARRAEYNKTVSELQSLSNRELADLGLTRSSIRAAAYEAVYGA